MSNYMLADLTTLQPTACPCGESRRAFAVPENTIASVHLVEIKKDAQAHYHKKMSEIYIILQGEGHLELDGEVVPVKPLTTIFIKPGCRHRAVGDLRIINIAIPTFDASDEWFD